MGVDKFFVGLGTCGIAAGAERVFGALEATGKAVPSGCIGMCYLEPLVVAQSGDKYDIYVNVDETCAKALANGNFEAAAPYRIPEDDKRILDNQTRVVLANCGKENPEDISDYIKAGGYQALSKCLKELPPEAVIDEIKTSGLRGRGGAGFPTWFKWDAALKAQGEQKYVVCNADEGDPGAFMDRAVIEGDPHAVIEGMALAAYSIGASKGVVYVRAEYPLAIKRLNIALNQARERGHLGDDIYGSGFSFDITVAAGAGAFVCGEETALIASLEGERGMPRLKPPFPAQKGLFASPTNINNVETYANVPWIIRNGGAAFAAMGTEKSKGSKVFAITGKIQKGGLVEAPMGAALIDIINNLGGGVKDGGRLKAVQMGGPSGGCVPLSLMDTTVDYDELAKTGAIMGSGGMVVLDETTCMVDLARFFLNFTRKESCGKCVSCRVGTMRMLEILERICDGHGEEGDAERLEELANQVKETALCGLGQTAPNPVLTTLKYFRQEYDEHIRDKHCAAGQCANLITFTIDESKCIGCGLCAKACPAKAISGEIRKPFKIDTTNCRKCGECVGICKKNAVIRG